ncbi:ABC transporter substrate-binding protein [Noviherbaspirillum saxi]|uniref:ABC transporter substrate-binding protein n=1 Tax=Noviherbaspirillum saxi TaxID=2320863 RepID=A0A3A3FP38_9BURK|nr:ABC transporter substrate-binding protein [Noviherbaspirillum saxi]RJF95449.1 ABC transporter substrate-binding protein [Noviherbaspirillum saxi]
MGWKISMVALACAFGATASVYAQVQGVTDKEIVLGVITDLSGAVAQYGKESRNGMQMKVDEINAQGGVNGRKLRLVVEDNGYDPKKAVLATQKLVTGEKVFAVLGHLGTATNMAVLPFLIENKVFNFLPQGASKEFYDPPNPYKVALAPSYRFMATTSLRYLLEKKDYKKIGVLYQDDDFGQDVLAGVELQLKADKKSLVEKVSYKRGATDFSSQMAKLRAADCDLVIVGATLRELVGSVLEAKKIGFSPAILTTAAAYSQQVPALGGRSMDGIYASSFIPLPYNDDPNPAVREYAAAYTKRFNESPGLYSMYGTYTVDSFAKIAAKAGKNLTPETFNAAMESTRLEPDNFGNPGFVVTKNDRLAVKRIRMFQIVDGKWRPVSDLIETAAHSN